MTPHTCWAFPAPGAGSGECLGGDGWLEVSDAARKSRRYRLSAEYRRFIGWDNGGGINQIVLFSLAADHTAQPQKDTNCHRNGLLLKHDSLN